MDRTRVFSEALYTSLTSAACHGILSKHNICIDPLCLQEQLQAVVHAQHDATIESVCQLWDATIRSNGGWVRTRGGRFERCQLLLNASQLMDSIHIAHDTLKQMQPWLLLVCSINRPPYVCATNVAYLVTVGMQANVGVGDGVRTMLEPLN
jgi:hypothetical protein